MHENPFGDYGVTPEEKKTVDSDDDEDDDDGNSDFNIYEEFSSVISSDVFPLQNRRTNTAMVSAGNMSNKSNKQRNRKEFNTSALFGSSDSLFEPSADALPDAQLSQLTLTSTAPDTGE